MGNEVRVKGREIWIMGWGDTLLEILLKDRPGH